jgi:uncharacterized protein YdeI (YjbR/CyaY-like superfamily)
MIETDRFAKVELSSVTELHQWLAAHHAQPDSVWLVTFKKHVPARYISTSEVLDALLCYGWIDGIRRKLDGDRTMQLVSPRRQQIWAQTYKDRAARLIADGRMAPAGLATIATSQRDGLWDAMADVDALVVPSDMQAALNALPPAADHFAVAAPSYQRNVLRWIKSAKTLPTRARRIGLAVDYSARSARLPQM